MKYGDLWGGIFFFCLSVWVCFESIRFDLGRLSAPGPGLLPFCSGFLLGSFSLYLTVEALLKRSLTRGKDKFGQTRWKQWFLTVASIVGYALLLELLGFVLCTLLFMVILLALVEPQRWTVVLLVSSITTAIAYFIFQFTLKSQLPRGVLGI